MLTRRAVTFVATGQVEVGDEPLDPPGLGEVLVATRASGISPGTELLIYRGQAPTELAADETIEALGGDLSFPLKYGYSAAGTVVALGPNVAPIWLGRTVFAFQPHQSHFVAPVGQLVPLPEDVSAEEAVLLPNVETAVNLLLDGRPAIGEQVAVFGQGIVGLLTTALLARMPLAALVTLDRYPRRRELSLELGARASLDPTAEAVADRLAELLQGDRAYAGADLAFEVSGSPAALDQAIAATGFNGRVVVASWYGRKPVELQLGGRFHRARQSVVSSQVSTIAPELSGRWTRARRLKVAMNELRQLRPARLITHRFPLERAADAYALLDQHPDEAVQVVLSYGNDRT
jgi:2-desacetyl-2-hydroxyethyl bacteriochlorophyllide A dehydrogenase